MLLNKIFGEEVRAPSLANKIWLVLILAISSSSSSSSNVLIITEQNEAISCIADKSNDF